MRLNNKVHLYALSSHVWQEKFEHPTPKPYAFLENRIAELSETLSWPGRMLVKTLWAVQGLPHSLQLWIPILAVWGIILGVIMVVSGLVF